jgi:hypothetical protein
VIIAIIAVLAVLIAGVVAVALTRPGSAGPGQHPHPGTGRPGRAAFGTVTAVRSQAAGWIFQQVSRSAIVACDAVMCAALQARGVPAASLLVLQPDEQDPLGADLVVATAAVRSQFGTRLASVYAPSVMASFGSGAARIDVRILAPRGAAVYRAALTQDEAARKSVAGQLLANPQIQVSAPARTQLADGQVDSRLLLLLPVMAAIHPVRVLSFGDAAPGAAPGIPLTSAQLSAAAAPGGMTQRGYVRWLLGFLRGQRPPYVSVATTARQQGTQVVQIRFARPTPLGLIAGKSGR